MSLNKDVQTTAQQVYFQQELAEIEKQLEHLVNSNLYGPRQHQVQSRYNLNHVFSSFTRADVNASEANQSESLRAVLKWVVDMLADHKTKLPKLNRLSKLESAEVNERYQKLKTLINDILANWVIHKTARRYDWMPLEEENQKSVLAARASIIRYFHQDHNIEELPVRLTAVEQAIKLHSDDPKGLAEAIILALNAKDRELSEIAEAVGNYKNDKARESAEKLYYLLELVQSNPHAGFAFILNPQLLETYLPASE